MRSSNRVLILGPIFVFCFVIGLFASSKQFLMFPPNGSTKDRSLAWVSEGIARSLSNQLQSNGNTVLSQDERINLLEREDLPSEALLSQGSMIRVAQQAAVDFVVTGKTKGSEKDLKISIWLLDMNNMKLSREIAVSGPLSTLPQMENEIAWLILSESGLTDVSREVFRGYARAIPNAAYASYIESFHTSSENEQIKLLQHAIDIFGAFSDAHFQLGRLYYQKKEWENAVPHFLRGMDRNEFRFPGQFMLGNCYLLTGNYRLAIASFSQNLYFSRSIEILNNLGAAYLRLQENEIALKILLEAKSLSNTDPTVSFNLAIAQFLAGNVPVSRAIVKEALSVHPENGLLQFFHGSLLKEQGDSEQAAAVLLKATKLGIPVEKLQSEDMRMWTRSFINPTSSKTR